MTAHLVVMSHADRAGGLVLAASPAVKRDFGIKTGSRRYEVPDDPRLIIAPPQMKLYLKVNKMILDIARRYVSKEDLYVFSIDEFFMDVTQYHALFGNTMTIAKKLQQDILKELRLFVTIGIGENPFLAKVSLDVAAKHQSNGIAEWRYPDIPNTLWKIPDMTEVVGIGQKTAIRLENVGISSIYALAHAPIGLLKQTLGIMGVQLYYHANGIDYSRLSETYTPISKSFGKSQILERDYYDMHEVAIIVREMAEEVAMRIRKEHAQTACVHLSLGYSKHSILRGFSHQMKVYPTDSSKKITEYALHIFHKYIGKDAVRSVAISAGKITYKEGTQLNLFEDAVQTIYQEQLERTIDHIRNRYGFRSMMHASSLLEGATGLSRSQMVGGHQG
uniref:Y-family DNA polymerase n=1 Tax=Listeria booriae TaxID=1552123 RepID=UPI0021AB3852|nr:excinuclease ABC subunit A [Listeria booriae]